MGERTREKLKAAVAGEFAHIVMGIPLPNGPVCPHCGTLNECATSVKLNSMEKPKGPKAGDISVCYKCGEICVFTEAITYRAASAIDLLTLEPRMRILTEEASKDYRRKYDNDRRDQN